MNKRQGIKPATPWVRKCKPRAAVPCSNVALPTHTCPYQLEVMGEKFFKCKCCEQCTAACKSKC